MYKYLIVLILFSSSVVAEYTIEAKKTQIGYSLGSYGDFKFNAYQVGGTYYHNDIGFTLLGGQSEQSHGNYMRNFWVLNIHKRFRITNDVTTLLGVNFVEYKACHVLWGCNPDTGQGLSAALLYRTDKNTYLSFSIDDYYTKYNDHLGKETTRSTGLSLIRVF